MITLSCWGATQAGRGRHPDYGSANTLFKLDNIYLELLAAEGSGWAGDRVTQHIADKGQGLMGLVFGVAEIAPFIDHARNAGLDISDPMAGHGTDLAETAKRSWQNMVWPDAPRAAFSVLPFAMTTPTRSNRPLSPGRARVRGLTVVVQTSDTQASKISTAPAWHPAGAGTIAARLGRRHVVFPHQPYEH